METGMPSSSRVRYESDEHTDLVVEPGWKSVALAFCSAAVFVFATRWPVARPGPFEFDEIGFIDQAAVHWFPMHHTLFITFAVRSG